MAKDGSKKTAPGKGGTDAATRREQRLKAALRANLQRRKAQGRARKENDSSSDG